MHGPLYDSLAGVEIRQAIEEWFDESTTAGERIEKKQALYRFLYGDTANVSWQKMFDPDSAKMCYEALVVAPHDGFTPIFFLDDRDRTGVGILSSTPILREAENLVETW